jgi:hypothetical protein
MQAMQLVVRQAVDGPWRQRGQTIGTAIPRVGPVEIAANFASA